MRRYCNLFVVLIWATLSRAQVRVREGTLVLPLYEKGMPDPNPMPQLQSLTSPIEAAGTRVALRNRN